MRKKYGIHALESTGTSKEGANYLIFIYLFISLNNV